MLFKSMGMGLIHPCFYNLGSVFVFLMQIDLFFKSAGIELGSLIAARNKSCAKYRMLRLCIVHFHMDCSILGILMVEWNWCWRLGLRCLAGFSWNIVQRNSKLQNAGEPSRMWLLTIEDELFKFGYLDLDFWGKRKLSNSSFLYVHLNLLNLVDNVKNSTLAPECTTTVSNSTLKYFNDK